MKVGFVSLGCSKNLIDTEMAIGLFKRNNFEIVNDEIKKYYTLEELIALYKKVNENEIRVKNLRLDEKALTNRLNNLNYLYIWRSL